MMLGVPERRTHSYVRHGTNVAVCGPRHRFRLRQMLQAPSGAEFLDFLKQIDARVPDGLDVHIIMDNYATHKTAAIKNLGWRGDRTTRCTSRQLRRRGSIKPNGGSPSSPESSCVAASIPQQSNWKQISTPSSSATMKIQALSMDQIRRRNSRVRQTFLPKNRADVMQRILDSRD